MDEFIKQALAQAPAVGILLIALVRVYTDLMATIADNKRVISALEAKVDDLTVRLARIEAKQ